MTEVTYFVALPFVAVDDGIAAGEPTECFNPVAVVMRRRLCRVSRDMWGPWALNRTTQSGNQSSPNIISLMKTPRNFRT